MNKHVSHPLRVPSLTLLRMYQNQEKQAVQDRSKSLDAMPLHKVLLTYKGLENCKKQDVTFLDKCKFRTKLKRVAMLDLFAWPRLAFHFVLCVGAITST